jgi:hypothetical protein
MRGWIVLKYDLRSGRKILPSRSRLRVLVGNSQGARAVDGEGDIHVINAGDFVWCQARQVAKE